MLYLDTSLLVAALTPEQSTHRVQQWLEAHSPDTMMVGHLVITEFSRRSQRK